MAHIKYQRMKPSGDAIKMKDSGKSTNPVALLCVDEAHCLSQWSFNFRPSFLRIKRELKYIEPQSVLALTATASPGVEKDILEHLSIPSQEGVFRSPCTRHNLLLRAQYVSALESKNEVICMYAFHYLVLILLHR